MAEFTRRQGLALAGGLAIGGLAARLAAQPAERGLDAIARTRGLRFGSAVAAGRPGADRGSVTNPAYTALLERDCGILVAENEMKWQRLRPTATTFDFTAADAIVDYGTRHGMVVRGHNLLWHQPKWLPRWMATHDFGPNPAKAAEAMLTGHIRTVVDRYGARVPSWDVVNEAVKPEDGTLYETPLSKALGGPEAALDLAFRTARAAGPRTELVYNDYMSWGDGSAKHRAGVLKLLEGFRARNVPVDALGLQSHLVTQGVDVRGTAAKQEGDWRAFLDAVTGMGYRLLITELDVRDNGLPVDAAARDRGVADHTRAYLDLTLSYPQIRDVLAWGMSDRYSWIEGFEPRADKAPRRPTLYDRDFRAKPMREAVAAALAAAPPRPAA
jgi:endo-1,4-beta-xylanase